MGKKNFIRTGNELKNIKFQRSIYVVKNIMKGEKFSSMNVRRIRPGYSLPANKWNKLIGKVAKRDLHVGSRITKNDFK